MKKKLVIALCLLMSILFAVGIIIYSLGTNIINVSYVLISNGTQSIKYVNVKNVKARNGWVTVYFNDGIVISTAQENVVVVYK